MMILRHNRQIIVGHRVENDTIDYFLSMMFIHARMGSRQESGVERGEIMLGHNRTDRVAIDMFAVTHHFEQQSDGAVAAVDGLGCHAEGVITVRCRGDIKVREQAALCGVERDRALANDLMESVRVVFLVHKHSACDREGVGAKHHHGVVSGGYIGTCLHAAGFDAVGQVRVYPVGLSLVTEITNSPDVHV